MAGPTKIEFNATLLKIGAIVLGAIGIAIFYVTFPHAPWFGAAAYAFLAGLLVDSLIWLVILIRVFRHMGADVEWTDTNNTNKE